MRQHTKIHPDNMIQKYFDEAACTFMVDLTDDIINDDIISTYNHNITAAVGLCAPHSYTELIRRTLSGNYPDWECTIISSLSSLTSKELLATYENGQHCVEVMFHFARGDLYYRLIHIMDTDKETGHVMAYVLCHNINMSEKFAQKEFVNISNIISNAGIGIWHIYLFENEEPRMKTNAKMKELLGISTSDMTEEEVYAEWFSRIKKSAVPSVLASVEEMQTKGKSENTYAWLHPTLGEIYVRCGGIASYVEGKGYILRGYHSDVTEIINSDTKQKQLLADALEEVKYQKRLLQQALDNYKQADYDRRRDYLTGLRNRQDMYEMLQDSLSGIRSDIKAMFMMDLDNFKMLNDNYGHAKGDECLRTVSKALMDYGKEHNIYFYRYGGEEILGISFGCDKPESQIADEIVKLVYDLQIKRDDVKTKTVTISLGYTCDTSSYEKMIDKADKAMYHAKSSGKNCFACYETL